MRRITLGDLDLSTIDRNDADTQYIYNEVFNSRIYHFERMRLPAHPTIMDVGANIGLYALWAHQRYQPRTIHCYEASPRTFACLQDNIARLIRPETAEVHTFNRAIAARMEVDYLPETGIKPDDVEGMLQAMGYQTDCLDRSLSNGLTFYAWRTS